jgi:hypothetical protein
MIKLKVSYDRNDIRRLSDPNMPYFLDLIDLGADEVLKVIGYTDVGFDEMGYVYYDDLKKIQIPFIERKEYKRISIEFYSKKQQRDILIGDILGEED